ncbi:hypothetical protein GN244_ATG11515 [Phytophthora infestans]|uniref:Uncharacterized protein n=1 Tax=Phytophthora infestans TaxID=4787 RepID=A0A833SZY0_PHYIN|nr:hypothetical protein GN244_ATG11515 [Phytophthora infestans]KAF4146123.1 hypothetical protein GN958_ATG04598 [Phytophthora infestans]
MVFLKQNLIMSTVALLLLVVPSNGNVYQSKHALRQAAVEVVEVEKADDSECGALDMAEEENTGVPRLEAVCSRLESFAHKCILNK